MSVAPIAAMNRPGPAALAAGVQDLALAELSPAQQAALDALDGPWLSSYAFSTLFFERGATRVRCTVDDAGQVARAWYYREDRWSGRWKQLAIFGPVAPEPDTLDALLRERGAHLAIIHRMAPADLPASRPWSHVATRRNGEDFVAVLPSTAADYLVNLGQRLRKRLPNYTRRVQREFGADYRVVFAQGPEITREMVENIIALNTARNRNKGLKPMWSEDLIALRWQFAREHGVFCGVMRGDTLAGGTLSYLHRHEAALAIIAHDPAFDYLHIGYVSLLLTVERLIDLGIRRYHYLWGRLRYKSDFGGEFVKLHDVVWFANPAIALLWRLRTGLPALLSALRVQIQENLTDEQLEKFRQLKRRVKK